MTTGFAIAHVDDIEALDDGRVPMQPVRHHFGITSFGVNAFTAPNPGDRLINEHQEDDDGGNHEELYLVLSGRATFELDGERRDAPTGTFVFVPAAVKRTAVAEEPNTTIVAVGGTPGEPYNPMGWEVWSPLRPLYLAGEYDTVLERLRPMAAENPQYPLLQYNLACLESLTGRSDEALEHLRAAIDGFEQFRDYAANDTDLDAIRDEPAFQELVTK
jgi:hypothetical protein